MKKNMAVLICLVTILTSCLPAFAESQLEKRVMGKDNLEISTYNDKGVTVEVFRSDGSVDKKQIEAEFEVDKIYTRKISGNYEIDASKKSSTNSNCEVKSTGYIHSTTITPFKIKVWGGKTIGYLWGTDPVSADKIVLRQRYDFSGVGVTVSWPPGFSGSSKTREWVSSDYEDTWKAVAHREEASGSCLVSLFSVEVEDGSDTYISNVCHKARYKVKKGVWDWV